MFVIVLLVGLAGLVIGIIASVKGEFRSLHIPNRKAGTVVTIISLFFVLISGSFIEGNEEGAAEEVTAEASEKESEKKEEETKEKEQKKESDLRDADWIEVTEEITFENDEIQITGETNLEDKAVFLYEIENVDHADNFLEGTMEVMDGVFSEEIDIASFNDGEIEVWVALELDDQPENVRKRFNMEEATEGFAYSKDGSVTKYAPIDWSGSGDTATEEFSLIEGFAVFEMNHEGGSNFAAKLKDETGETVKLLVNEIGNYEGNTFVLVPFSEAYSLDITADGSWGATISQMIPEEVESDPVTIEGTGDDVVFIDVEPGKKRFELSHTGDSNFAIHLNGSHLLVNEIGAYEGSSTESFADEGVHAFSIIADGEWTLTIE